MLRTEAARLLLPSGPSRTSPAPFGLLSVVEDLTPSDPHWVNGVEWEFPSCAAVSGVAGECEDDFAAVFLRDSLSQYGSVAAAQPFSLYGSHLTNPIADGEQRAFDYATANLERHEQEGAEAALWSGSLNTTPILAANTTTDLTPTPGTAVPIDLAIGLLSAHAASTFGVAGSVIHAPRKAGPAMVSQALIKADGSTMTTPFGEKVALEAGSPNTSPAGVAADAGQAWLYVTPPVAMLASSVETYWNQGAGESAGLFDRARNELYAMAMRTYVFGWDDCLIAAVLADISGAAGTGS